MSISFQEALRIAKERVRLATGEDEPELLRSDHEDRFIFKLGTAQGAYDLVVETDGAVTVFAHEGSLGRAPEARMAAEGGRFPSTPAISEEEAVEKAMCYVGDGRLLNAELRKGVWVVEIDAGPERGVLTIDIGKEGVVSVCKRSQLTPVIDIE